MPTGRTIKPANDLRARDVSGYDDQATFGELWQTHDWKSVKLVAAK
jgi:hypothetical protein